MCAAKCKSLKLSKYQNLAGECQKTTDLKEKKKKNRDDDYNDEYEERHTQTDD